MITAFGFEDEWVEWIKKLVSSTLFSILVNGVPSCLIKPSRGIRQGDPLPPFLFILMAEVLGRSISAFQDNNALRGIRVHGKEDKQTHQIFVYDTMMMGYRSVQEARNLKEFLSNFGKALGLENLSHMDWTLVVALAIIQVPFSNIHPATSSYPSTTQI